MIGRALISVSDKEGIVAFAQALAVLGVEIISTGGTASEIAGAGIHVTTVATVTAFPEILDGRVKTLHPAVHGGILARRDQPRHMETILRHEIREIDLVCVNLYPFAQTIEKDGCTLEDAIENIDIGGPAMIRSAAKNHDSVTVLVDPSDYEEVLGELRDDGMTNLRTRQHLAAKAFAHTGAYDGVIAGYLAEKFGIPVCDIG